MVSKISMLSLFILLCGECSCVHGQTKALPTLTSLDLKGCDCCSWSTYCDPALHQYTPDSIYDGNNHCHSKSLHASKATESRFKKPSSLVQMYLNKLLVLFLFYFQYSFVLTELVLTRIRILGLISISWQNIGKRKRKPVPKINARILILSALFHVYRLSYVITVLNTLTTQLIWICVE